MRPKSLGAIAQFVAQGDSFDRCFSNFLDEFYALPNASALADEPALLAPELGNLGGIQNAYLAAAAEELARKFSLPQPEWKSATSRRLRRPWFASPLASLRAVLLLESPSGFRSRNLFVSENALSRA